jgi:hypothetical protein
MLGMLLGLLGPAPFGATKRNSFLPITAMFAKWLEQLYTARLPTVVQCTWSIADSNFLLKANERTKLIGESTKQPEKCMVLISTYSISSAGLNQQNQCRNTHLFSPPTSRSVVNQAIGRLSRYSDNPPEWERYPPSIFRSRRSLRRYPQRPGLPSTHFQVPLIP